MNSTFEVKTFMLIDVSVHLFAGFMLLYICYVCAVLIARQFEPVNVDQTPSHDEERSDEHAPLLGEKTRVEDNRCNQLRALLCDINPIDVEGWNSKGYIMRFFEIYKVWIGYGSPEGTQIIYIYVNIYAKST